VTTAVITAIIGVFYFGIFGGAVIEQFSKSPTAVIRAEK